MNVLFMKTIDLAAVDQVNTTHAHGREREREIESSRSKVHDKESVIKVTPRVRNGTK